MSIFHEKNGELYIEQVSATSLAKQYGTPLYVYSKQAFIEHFQAYRQALGEYPHLICYSVKANSNLSVLQLLAEQGCGFDIVSVGELERVLRAGGKANKVVFSGVGKQPDEMRRALEVGVHCFNVESESELQTLNQVAQSMGKKAPVSLRVNPDVNANTHPYISTGLKENKFGIDIERAPQVYAQGLTMAHIELIGIDCHIGSQLTELSPFMDALERLLLLAERIEALGVRLKHLDLGGGLGVTYKDETPITPDTYLSAVKARLKHRPYELILEPGRSIAANAGLFLCQVQYLKQTADKHFAVVDGAMNDLIRPSLYSAWQQVRSVKPNLQIAKQCYDVVGPICETGDFLAKQRDLRLQEGDLLAVMSAGAYGFVMASNYNTRPRAAEVLVSKQDAQLIRQRETLDDVLANEVACLSSTQEQR